MDAKLRAADELTRRPLPFVLQVESTGEFLSSGVVAAEHAPVTMLSDGYAPRVVGREAAADAGDEPILLRATTSAIVAFERRGANGLEPVNLGVELTHVRIPGLPNVSGAGLSSLERPWRNVESLGVRSASAAWMRVFLAEPLHARFRVDGYGSLETLLLPGRRASLVVQASAMATVTFRDAADGAGIAGLEVTVYEGATLVFSGSTKGDGGLTLPAGARPSYWQCSPAVEVLGITSDGDAVEYSKRWRGVFVVPSVAAGAQLEVHCRTDLIQVRPRRQGGGSIVGGKLFYGLQRRHDERSFYSLGRASSDVRDGIAWLDASELQRDDKRPTDRLALKLDGYAVVTLPSIDSLPADGAVEFTPSRERTIELLWQDGSRVVDCVDVYDSEHGTLLALSYRAANRVTFDWAGRDVLLYLRSVGSRHSIDAAQLAGDGDAIVRLPGVGSGLEVTGVPAHVTQVVVLGTGDGVILDLSASLLPLRVERAPDGTSTWSVAGLPPGRYYQGTPTDVQRFYFAGYGKHDEALQLGEGERASVAWNVAPDEYLAEDFHGRVEWEGPSTVPLFVAPLHLGLGRISYTAVQQSFAVSPAGDFTIPRGSRRPDALFVGFNLCFADPEKLTRLPLGVFPVQERIPIQGGMLELLKPRSGGEAAQLGCRAMLDVEQLGPFRQYFFDDHFDVEFDPIANWELPLMGSRVTSVQVYRRGGDRMKSIVRRDGASMSVEPLLKEVSGDGGGIR